MIKSPADVLGYCVVAVMLYAFGCGVYGYAVLLRQAYHSADRRLALRRVWDWRGNEHLMDSRGLACIYRCARIGAVLFSLLFVWLLYVLTR